MKGCGKPTHVTGTNGGTMACGSLLTMFGKTEPYYCIACEMAEQARALEHPTEGEFAVSLWRLSNLESMPPATAARIMEACGYVPFQGYPLTRKAEQKAET